MKPKHPFAILDIRKTGDIHLPPVFLYGFFIYAIVYFWFRGDFITITIFIIKRSFPMLYPAVELVCFAIESLIDLIIYSSLLNIKFKSLRHLSLIHI